MRLLIFISLLSLACCKEKEDVSPTSSINEIQTYDSLFLYNTDSLKAGKTNGWVLKYSLNNAVLVRRDWYKHRSDAGIATEFSVIGWSIDLTKDTIKVGSHYNTSGYIVRY